MNGLVSGALRLAPHLLICCLVIAIPSFVLSAPARTSRDVSGSLSDLDLARILQIWDASPGSYYPRSQEVSTPNDMEAVPLKRRLSVNNDLVSLADMLQNGAARRKAESAQTLLQKIGKRASLDLWPSESVQALLPGLPLEAMAARDRRGRLSVALPLDALTDMIHNKRRKMLHSQLMAIGKRSTLLDRAGRL